MPHHVAFRADASLTIGSGHVMRCLSLADALAQKGARTAFVMRDCPGHLFDLVRTRGHTVIPLPSHGASLAAASGAANLATGLAATSPASNAAGAAASSGPANHAAEAPMSSASAKHAGGSATDTGFAIDASADAALTVAGLAAWTIAPIDWLVVDHYGLDAAWERALRTSSGNRTDAATPAAAPDVRHLLAIDDLADRPHDCDALLDQNLTTGGAARYDGLLPAHCERLVGPRYALLQPPYAPLHQSCKPRRGPIRRLLIFFGGADRHGLTLRALQAALALNHDDLTIDVVIGMSSPDNDQVRALAAPHKNVTVYCGLPSLAPFMAEADLAIGAGGATSWERLCLGLPSIVVTVADNQQEVTQLLANKNLIDWIGNPQDATTSALAAALQARLATGNEPGWFPDYDQLIDGCGVERVCAVLMDKEPRP